MEFILYIQKTILSAPYGVPLSVHKIHSYVVNPTAQVTTANIECFYDENALTDPGIQPLSRFSIVVRGVSDISENPEKWLCETLITEDLPVENEFTFPGIFQPIERNTLSGGVLVENT